MSLNIIAHEFEELSGDLESKLHLLTEHILLDQNQVEMQVNLKLISSNEMIKLNGNFRHKELDTNVLSFPVGEDIQSIAGELGDIAMSFAYIQSESQSLNRDIEDHMMHLLAHGILHLLGFDHTEEKDANIMEAKEIKYLELFNIANPYLI